MIFCLFIIWGCEKEIVNVAVPKPGPVTIQMLNFNVPLDGGTLDNTAPDIYYFKQKEDGSFAFMLTYNNDGNFETNWQTDYVMLYVDKTGVIQKKELKKLPSKDGITGTFEYVWDAPPNTFFLGGQSLPMNRATSGPSYLADEHGFLYYQLDKPCFCRDQFFNLNPETGQSDYVSVGTAPGLARSFRTSDGGFISVGWEGSPNFAKYSSAGTLQFKQPMKYWEARPSYDFLTERNDDFYFVVLYNGGYTIYDYPGTPTYDPQQNGSFFENFSENKATSFLYLKDSKMIAGAIEFRFGPGIKQKAHRFDRFDNYQDYVEVPFEVWDVERNPPQQVMVSFRDQDGSGKFDLFPFKYDKRHEKEDTNQSREIIWINYSPNPEGGFIDYSETPDTSIKNTSFLRGDQSSFVWAYLSESATWDPATLTNATFSQTAGKRPEPQLIKVNANGTSVVKENFVLGAGVKFKTLYKSVPFQDGFAVLINAQQVTLDKNDVHLRDYGYQPTQLVILDAGFNQTNIIDVKAKEGDYGHQLESNKDQFFYARVTTNPNGTGNKSSLLISTIRNNNLIDRYVDFDVEKFRITPVREGGVALVAWVQPTFNTRDLVFMKFDENLELVTSDGN